MKGNYLNLLGLAFRARQVSLGEETIVKDIRKRNAKLVLVASDTGRQTLKKMTDKCETYNIPLIHLDDNRDVLSHAIGQTGRVAIAILEDGFASKIESLLGYD